MPDFAQIKAGQVLKVRDFASDDLPTVGRWLPVSDTGEDFDPATQVREGPELLIQPKRVLRSYTVRPKTPDEIAAERGSVVSLIKNEAAARILAIMPEHQQRNSLALGMEMVTTHGHDPAGWPAEIQARYAVDIAAWAQIKAVRLRSNELEAAVPDDPAGIAAFDPGAGWD